MCTISESFFPMSYLEAAVFFFPQVLSDEVHGRYELDGPHQDQARFNRECLWKSAKSIWKCGKHFRSLTSVVKVELDRLHEVEGVNLDVYEDVEHLDASRPVDGDQAAVAVVNHQITA